MRKKALLQWLNAAHGAATMQKMALGMPGDKVTFKGKEYDLNDFVREQTRLYRDTWIISPIVRSIEEIERDTKKVT